MRLSFLLVFAVYTTFGQLKKKTDPILFKIGDSPVLVSEFEYLFNKNHQSKPEAYTPSGMADYLELYINFKLKVKEAYSQGIDTTQAFIKEFEGYKNEAFKSYQAKRDDTDRLVAEAYDRMKEEVRASHILLMVDPAASPADTLNKWNQIMDLRAKVMGGQDFGEMAKAYSEDPGAKETAGDLGYFTALEMVYAFENAAFKTPVGQVSMPVRSRFGYHLIKVMDRRLAGDQVEVAHILVQGKDDRAFNKIKEAYGKLKAGEIWIEVCRNYSEDSSNKENGGRLQPFRKGGFDPAAKSFEDAAFSLKNVGDFSEPILTPYGWHIVRLEKLIHLPEFNSYAPELKKRIAQDERVYLSALRQLELQKKSLSFQEDQGVIEKMISLADSSLLSGRWEFYGDPDFRTKALFKMAGESAPVWSFVEFISRVQEPIPTTALGSITPAELMRQMLDGFVSMRASTAEEKKLESENQSYRMLLKEYREGILLFSIMEQEVWKKASSDTVAQRMYYQANISRYQAGDRIRARMFGMTDAAVADAILTKYQMGDTINKMDMRKFRTATPWRNYEKGESRIIDRVPWSIGLYRTELDKVIWLIEIKRLIPPGIKTLEEAKALVISDYQDVLEQQWLISLKSKYSVMVDERIKKQTFKRLSKSTPTDKKSTTAP